MAHFLRFVSLLLVAVLAAGCAAVGPADLLDLNEPNSEKERVAEPPLPLTDLEILAEGNRAFALSLFHVLPQGENLFFSPYSISLALAMTYAGARGETEQQMAQALQFTLPQARLHPAFSAVGQDLASRKDLDDFQGGLGADDDGFRLHIVNNLWGQQGHPFQAEFLDLLSANYGGDLRLVDFIKDPEDARQTINDTVAEQTEQRIKELIPAGAIDPLTRLVLTNAIYFNAAWQYEFASSMTEPGAFTRLDGSRVEVPMMESIPHSLGYQDGNGYQAVALPYENDHLVMWILIPDRGHYARFEATLDSDRLESILSHVGRREVHLTLPRFQLDNEFFLGEMLRQLGMPLAFDPAQADFTGISSQGNLSISEVVHKALVKVDEKGTEAVAASAIITLSDNEPVIVNLTIDRPFIFLIYDKPTQSILFMGRVLDPTTGANAGGAP